LEEFFIFRQCSSLGKISILTTELQNIMNKKMNLKKTLGTLCLMGLIAPSIANDKAANEAEAQKNTPDQHQAAFQGEWRTTSMRANGTDAPAKIVKIMNYEFSGNRLSITPAEGGNEYTFQLDPDAKPFPTIDLTPVKPLKEAEKMKGIYRMKDGQLKICLGKMERPAQMRAEKADGFGVMLIELEQIEKKEE